MVISVSRKGAIELNDKIDLEEVKDKYNQIENIWSSKDRWHLHTNKKIKSFLVKNMPKYFHENSFILNAGSGGNSYDITLRQLHVDIAENKLIDEIEYVVSDICNMPFENDYFDGCMCVGSVLNYCDLIAAMRELSRVVKTGGYLFLEYESSKNPEFRGTDIFNANVAICKTFYQGSREKLWVYSPRFFKTVLNDNYLKILHEEPFHIASSIAYAILEKENVSSQFSALDSILKRLPLIKSYCSNIILICQKEA